MDNNVGQVHGQQSQPVKAFVEKITNSIDALLVLMCIKNGLDPTDWDNVPRTVSEAVEKFITKSKKHGLSLSEIERQIYVFAEGKIEKGKFPNKLYEIFENTSDISILQLFPYVSSDYNSDEAIKEIGESINNLKTRLSNLKKINKSLNDIESDSSSMSWDELKSITFNLHNNEELLE